MQLPDTGQHAETRNTPIAAIINAEANGPTPKSVVSRRDIVTRALPAVVLVSVAAITPAWLNSRTSSSPVTAQPTAGGSVSVVGKPTGGEPTVPFLRGNELARGGKRTALPSTLAPTSLKAAKQNLVVESRKGEESTAAIIDASGNVRILRIVKPPLAVHPDGARIAGMSTARGATGSAVVVVDSTSEKILAHVDLPVGSSPELFLGAGSAWVVLDHPAGASEVWNTETGARLTLGSLGSVSGARSTTHPTEDLVVSADEQGRLIAWRPQGSSVSVVWTGAVVADCPPAFSPSGMVVSYASSPAAELIYAETPLEEPPTGSIVADGTCWRQIEFAGILKGTPNRQLAEKFIDFLLSKAFQEDMPLQMFVYPVLPDAVLPADFARASAVPDRPASLDPQLIAAKRDEWVQAWTALMLK